MILSWKFQVSKLIITEVFQSNWEFDSPLSYITFICVAFEFDRQLYIKITGSTFCFGDNIYDHSYKILRKRYAPHIKLSHHSEKHQLISTFCSSLGRQ